MNGNHYIQVSFRWVTEKYSIVRLQIYHFSPKYGGPDYEWYAEGEKQVSPSPLPWLQGTNHCKFIVYPRSAPPCRASTHPLPLLSLPLPAPLPSTLTSQTPPPPSCP